MVWVEEYDTAEVFENEDAACADTSNFVDEWETPDISNPNLYSSSNINFNKTPTIIFFFVFFCKNFQLSVCAFI